MESHVKFKNMNTKTQQPGLFNFMKSLLTATLDDVADHLYSRPVEKWKDFVALVRRFHCEGLRFITQTLPSLGKAFDKAISMDVPFEVPAGFKSRGLTRIPTLLGSLFELVFEEDGRTRSDASPQAVRAIRQICYLAYKLQLPYTSAQETDTINRFKKNEEELHSWTPIFRTMHALFTCDSSSEDSGLMEIVAQDRTVRIAYIARQLIRRVMSNADPYDTRFRARHGTGAVATGERGEEKMQFKRFYRRLNSCFPYDQHFYYNLTHLCDDMHSFLSLAELEAGTARVVLVPKDSRGPRLISCEPLEYQWIQQSLMANMVETIEAHPITRFKVNFTDQSINRDLAMLHSRLDGAVTLDMKDASDRVHVDLVRVLFPETWSEALIASRSTATLLPSGEVQNMIKFAPMGSATCFPVEALVFWALCAATIVHEYYLEDSKLKKVSLRRALAHCVNSYANRTVCRSRDEVIGLQSADRDANERDVFVYGDDIICGKEVHIAVKQTLSDFGLIVNEDKSCTGRFFRESCGCDAFDGVDVTPLRLKAVYVDRFDPSIIIPLCAFQHALAERCFTRSALVVQNAVMALTGNDKLPIIHPLDPLLTNYNGEGGFGGLHLRSPLSMDYHTPKWGSWNRRVRLTPGDNDYSCFARRVLVPKSLTYSIKDLGWAEMLRMASIQRMNNLDFEPEKVRRSTPSVDRDALLEWALNDPTEVRAGRYTLARRVTLTRAMLPV